MPPKKGGAKDPAEEAAALVADLSAAADAAATAAALAALGTFAEAEGAALVAEGAALAPLLVGALDAGADAAAAAAAVLGALCTADGGRALLVEHGAVAPLAKRLQPAEGEEAWDEARAALARAACAALGGVAADAEGRYAVHGAGASAPLLALLHLAAPPPHVVALQTEAARLLAKLAENPLARVELRASADTLLALAAGGGADEASRRRQAALLLLCAYLQYDAKLRAALHDGGLLDRAVALVGAEAGADDDAAAAAALVEVKEKAASVLAIGAQAAAGRAKLVSAGGLASLLAPLRAAAGDAPPSAALVANAALAVAHAALSDDAAATLITDGALGALLPLVAPRDDADGAAAAVRGNAVAAVLHLAALPAGREALLADGAAGAAGVAAVLTEVAPAADGEAADGEEAPDTSAVDALVAGALGVIGELAVREEGRDALMALEPPPVAAMIGALQTGRPAVVEASLAALAPLAAHAGARAPMLGAAAEAADGDGADAAAPPPPIELLPPLLGADQPAALRRAAANCVAGLAAGADCAAALVALGVPAALAAEEEAAAKGGGGGGGTAAAAAAMAMGALCRALPVAQLWRTGEVPMGTTTEAAGGFYAVSRDRPLVSLDALRAAPPTDAPEVLLISPPDDAALQALLDEATAAITPADADADEPLDVADAARTIATLVAGRLGGAVPYDDYEHFDAAVEVRLAKKTAKSDVVPLGALKKGGARHRATLFKALADRLGVPCTLKMGACVRGAHAHHAWNLVVVPKAADAHAWVVVDLLHDVGALLPDGSNEARRYKRVDEFAFASLGSTRAAYTVPPTPALPAAARAA